MQSVVRFAGLVALAVLLGACDADTPTEPTQTPNAPVPTTATTAFAISVGLTPSTIALGEPAIVEITVVARRTDTNELMPRGSTALLSTTSGTLTNEDGTDVGNRISVIFGLNGTARAELTGVTVLNPEITNNVVIRAQIEQTQAQATLTVLPPPEEIPFGLIQAVPNFGPPTGGTTVRIEGSGFSLPAEVIFGGIPVPVLDITSTSIRVVSPAIELPAGQNRTVPISVFVNVGEIDAASGTLGSGFTYTRNSSPQNPQILSVTPTSGPNEGRTQVTIFGENFGSEVQVFFGAQSRIEAPVLSVSSNRIIVETPPATGQNSDVQNSVVTVRVVDLRSGFEATLPNAFQYGGVALDLTAIQPAEGIYLGGTLVTIFGAGGFEAPVAVNFGGADQQVVSVSGTEIVARTVPVEVGCAGANGGVAVTNIETGETGAGLNFAYRTITPRIDLISPDSAVVDVETGQVISGTTTTISGSGFDRQGFPPFVDFFNDAVSERSPAVSITSLESNDFYEDHRIGDVMVVEIPAFRPLNTEQCFQGGVEGTRFIDTRVTVRATVRETGCNGQVAASFTYIPNDTSCNTIPSAVFLVEEQFGGDPFTVNVIDQSLGDPTDWVWEFGDGARSQSQFPAPHTYAAAGTYTIKLTVSNDRGTSSSEQTITILGPPVADFSFAQDAGNPLLINFTDESTGNPTSWQWNFGDGNSSTEQNPSHTYGGQGTFTVTLTATNGSGSDTVSQTVTVTDPVDPPLAAFTLQSFGAFDPRRVVVRDASTGGEPDTWRWDFGDGTIIQGSGPVIDQDYTYAADGTFTITLTITNSSGSDTDSQQFTTGT